MENSNKTLPFPEIEKAIAAITVTELSLVERLTAQMQADLKLLEVFEQLKLELTNLISDK